MAGILLLTMVAVWWLPPLPEQFAGLRGAGPYAVLLIAMALAWWFNRGRAFVLAGSLLLGWGLFHLYSPNKAVYTAVVVLVPLNCLLAFVAPERGARYGPVYRWVALLAVEALLLLWLGSATKGGVFSGVPLVGRVVFAAAFAAAIWRAYPDHTPLQVADAGALGAFFIGAEWAIDPNVFAGFMTGAGAILLAALLQESHQLAFRDELTGLLGRRALLERLRSLGERYVIAMVDVDHFKKFNDTHGHDVGDQVLKLVAGRLGQVRGGGIAFRYGGEEFSVVFPYGNMTEAQQHLDAIRLAIERYKMAVRGADRPKRPDDTGSLRLNKPPQKTLSVTVSIGLAQPTHELRTPTEVLKAADEALYRAKQAGRNRVST